MKALFVSLFCLILSSLWLFDCAGDINACKGISTSDKSIPGCYHPVVFQVFAEDNGDKEMQLIITNSFQEWHQKTDELVSFEVSFVPRNKLERDSNVRNTIYLS